MTENDHDRTTREPLKSISSVTNSITTLNNETQTVSITNHSNRNTFDENLTNIIIEQRRNNRLLEQVIAAINTTNALLTQLIQR